MQVERLDDFAIYKDRLLTSGELTAAYNKFTTGDPLIA